MDPAVFRVQEIGPVGDLAGSGRAQGTLSPSSRPHASAVLLLLTTQLNSVVNLVLEPCRAGRNQASVPFYLLLAHT